MSFAETKVLNLSFQWKGLLLLTRVELNTDFIILRIDVQSLDWTEPSIRLHKHPQTTGSGVCTGVCEAVTEAGNTAGHACILSERF